MTTLAKPNLSESVLQAYRADYERSMQDAPGNLPHWLREQRRSAFQVYFSQDGFPARNHEDWRFTDIRSITDTPFALAGFEQQNVMAEQIGDLLFSNLTANRLVFVNGRFAPGLSHLQNLPQGVVVSSLAAALTSHADAIQRHFAQFAQADNSPFVALNQSFVEDGAFIHVPRGVAVADPILLVFVSNPGETTTVSHPRVLLVAEENSQSTLVEIYTDAGRGGYFTNAVTEIVVGANAFVDHVRVNQEAANAYHIGTTEIELERSANFTSHNVTLGSQIVRNDFNANLTGEGIECTLNGVYLAKDRQIVDNHTSIDHAVPHCNSHELYKGILDGRARGVFNGKIFVHEDAQKTDAKQTNQTLLLSNEATINTKPQLEIFADDVRCTHGATVGQLSEDALFYLRSRGIGKNEARAILTYAFANDVVGRIKVDAVRAKLEHLLLTELRRG